MDYSELLRFLGIEDPAEFEYFENLADIIESDEYIDEDALAELFCGVDPSVLSKLISDYFGELTEHAPASDTDFLALLGNVGNSLAAYAGEINNEKEQAKTFAEEFSRFRKWYSFEAEVVCRARDGSGEAKLSIAEALANYRADSFFGSENDYDFDSCLEFPLSEYVMAAEMEKSDCECDDDDCDFGHHHDHDHEHDHGHIHKHEGELYGHASSEILNDGFVYDVPDGVDDINNLL